MNIVINYPSKLQIDVRKLILGVCFQLRLVCVQLPFAIMCEMEKVKVPFEESSEKENIIFEEL